MAPKTVLSRRRFFRDTGGLLIGFSLANTGLLPRLLAAAPQDAGLVPSPDRLESWLQIGRDGRVQVFTGKMEAGTGVWTAFSQIVAEELDVPLDRVTLIMGDTSLTPNQGGVGGSNSVSQGAKPLANAAATARVLLLRLASLRLGAPPDQLQAHNGIVSVKGDASKSVSYGELVTAAGLQDRLKVSGEGFGVNAQGAGTLKNPAAYSIVGTSVPRVDLPSKILGRFQFVNDVRVPGMLHGRVIRPSSVGAKLVRVNEDSVKGIPGYVKTVVNGNFIGVLAEGEWAAVRAAKALKVTWDVPVPAFPDYKDLYQHMRATAPKSSRESRKEGNVEVALANAAKRVEASYDFPFQSHATMDPGCAVADVHLDGVTTVWSGTQKPHGLRQGIAELLNVSADQVRVIWVEDAGSYGRPGYEDAAADAALLSQAVGRPVRVQWMRADMTAWGTKGPAVVCDIVAGLDAQGEIRAVRFSSRAFSGGEVLYLPSTAGNFLAGQLTGRANTSAMDEFAQWTAPTYAFRNLEANAHIIASFCDSASPLRSTHLRDPNGPALWFAVESFIDEIAAAVGADPVDFRLKYLDDARAKGVLIAAAEKAGWDHRLSPRKNAGAENVVTGRGVALGPRGGTYVGTVAEVAVNRQTGAVHVHRLVCSHDCGLIINPGTLRGIVEGNLIQSLGRSLKEEVTFNRTNVTSVDWNTYPVARASDIPTQVDVVLLNHPEFPPSGAGEPASRATTAAIANAVFDATGARVRQAPLTPARVKAALARLQSA
jgi:nicotinate dehydrogenase subunit B